MFYLVAKEAILSHAVRVQVIKVNSKLIRQCIYLTKFRVSLKIQYGFNAHKPYLHLLPSVYVLELFRIDLTGNFTSTNLWIIELCLV